MIGTFILWYVFMLIGQLVFIVLYKIHVPDADFEFINAQILAVGFAIVKVLEKQKETK